MNYSNINLIILTQAIINAGWTKSVNIKNDGTLEWYNENGYPTDEQIAKELKKLTEKEVPYPTDGNIYQWDENNKIWIH